MSGAVLSGGQRWAAALGSVVVLVATAGCGGGPAGPAEVDEVATYESDGSGMDALLTGTVVREEGCVYVTDEAGSRILPVFPAGDVTWDGTTLGVDDGAQRVVVGETVELGGGEVTPSGDDADGWHVPSACDTTTVFLVAP